MQKASIGRIVHVLLDPAQNNGSEIAPAIVTQVWGDPFFLSPFNDTERQTINVRVLGDGAETLWLTSIALFDERPDAEALAAASPHNPKGYRAVAFWPPRVS